MLAIKLSQVGKKNKKMFRLIISEKGRDPYGNSLEILGSYNPHSKELAVKGDRVKYWLSKGAQMTATVNNLLISKNIIEGVKVTASKPGKQSEKKVAQAKAKNDKKAVAEVAKNVPATEEVKEEVAEEAIAEAIEEVKEEVKEETPVENA